MSIKEVLMERDGISEEEADNLIDKARAELADRLADGDFGAAEEVCMEYLGLESDYILELVE